MDALFFSLVFVIRGNSIYREKLHHGKFAHKLKNRRISTRLSNHSKPIVYCLFPPSVNRTVFKNPDFRYYACLWNQMTARHDERHWPGVALPYLPPPELKGPSPWYFSFRPLQNR